MQEKRIKIMSYVLQHGGKENLGLTWSEVLTMFDVEVNPSNLKQVSDFWRYTQKTGKLSPDHELGEIPEEYIEKDTLEELGLDIPEGYEVSKIWGNLKNPQISLVRKDKAEVEVDVMQELRDFITSYSPSVEAKSYQSENKLPIAYEISIPDFHFGRMPAQEARQLFLNTIVEMVGRVRNYHVEEFVLPIGNDFFNSDSIQYTTTKGTAQFDYDEWRELFRVGYMTILDAVHWLQEIAPVRIIMVPGNHDEQKTFYMGEIFAAYYNNNENVTVDNGLSSYKVWSYGVNGIMFDHGQLKEDYLAVFATEFPEVWVNSKVRECHNGHIHIEVVKEKRGFKCRNIPSIAPRSDWEKKMGYQNLRTCQAFKYHKHKGLIGIENESVIV